jgi:hypothetical protein
MRDDVVDLAALATLEEGFKIRDTHWRTSSRIFNAICDRRGANAEFRVFLR